MYDPSALRVVHPRFTASPPDVSRSTTSTTRPCICNFAHILICREIDRGRPAGLIGDISQLQTAARAHTHMYICIYICIHMMYIYTHIHIHIYIYMRRRLAGYILLKVEIGFLIHYVKKQAAPQRQLNQTSSMCMHKRHASCCCCKLNCGGMRSTVPAGRTRGVDLALACEDASTVSQIDNICTALCSLSVCFLHYP